ncbi:MAG: SUF system NifU family Fe-S cluster assembly protein [candidate division Zixibacteria bacterium]|nr:SUF system NifU family Fe-S cluster assembly protein [candidate division Zixibacteria bacterium]
MSDMLDELYRDVIMDHYRNPRGKKKLDKSDIHSEGKNPSCGDELEMDLQIKDGIIEDVHVGCVGCAISVSSGSMLAEVIKGKSIDEVKKIAEVVKKMLKGEPIPDDIEIEMGDLDALEGVKKFPVRIKCALLSWTTLIDSIDTVADNKERAFSTTE